MFHHLAKIFGRHIALALVLMGLWFLLSGYFEKATLVAFGVASVAICVWMADRAGALDREGVPTRVFPGIIGYMFWLTFEIGKANVLVALEAMRPKLKLSPKMIRVPAYQASDLGKTIFGNSVTLTPGTVTVAVEEDTLIIHALTEDLADEEAITAMGEKVCAFDGEEGRAWAQARKAEKGES
ncbi:MAG: Na+/H+ antiporter subunit E [Pseudomonadota bacterium]